MLNLIIYHNKKFKFIYTCLTYSYNFFPCETEKSPNNFITISHAKRIPFLHPSLCPFFQYNIFQKKPSKFLHQCVKH